jgi:hypothetical protein
MIEQKISTRRTEQRISTLEKTIGRAISMVCKYIRKSAPSTILTQQQIFLPRTSMQTPMPNKAWFLVPLFLSAASAFADVHEVSESNREICKGKTEYQQQCKWIDGTISIYNGTPSVRIHQRGSKRVYAVGPSEQELMPSDLKSKLTVDNAIDAKFRVCPLRKKNQGLKVVCIDEAKIEKVSERQ